MHPFYLKTRIFCCGAKSSFVRLYSLLFWWFMKQKRGSRDNSVGIATRYGLEGPGIESRWGEIFRTYPDRLQGPPSLLYNGYRVFPGGKCVRGVMLTTHPLLVARLGKSWAIPPLTLWILLGLLRGSLYHTYETETVGCSQDSVRVAFDPKY
jgi:hypothetical protein